MFVKPRGQCQKLIYLKGLWFKKKTEYREDISMFAKPNLAKIAQQGALSVLILAPIMAWSTPKPSFPLKDNHSSSNTAASVNPELIATKIKGFDQALISPNFSPTNFKTFLLAEPVIVFSPQWERDYRMDMSSSDEKRIRKSYSELLSSVLTKSLTEKFNLKPTQTPDAETLIVTPSLSNFRINAPDLDTKPMVKHYVEFAGAARLELSFKEGTSQKTLAEFKDYSETRSYGGIGDLKPTNRGINHQDFKQLFQRWTRNLESHFLVKDPVTKPK
jgi:hypothetical protein